MFTIISKTYFSNLKLTVKPIPINHLLYEKTLYLFVAIASFMSTVAQQKTDSTDKSAAKTKTIRE
jgi:hypothetical protein